MVISSFSWEFPVDLTLIHLMDWPSLWTGSPHGLLLPKGCPSLKADHSLHHLQNSRCTPALNIFLLFVFFCLFLFWIDRTWMLLIIHLCLRLRRALECHVMMIWWNPFGWTLSWGGAGHMGVWGDLQVQLLLIQPGPVLLLSPPHTHTSLLLLYTQAFRAP